MTRVRLHPEVADALAEGRPVVALETAVVTHGLPRAPGAMDVDPAWDASAPMHLEVARLMSRRVRAADATPATIGVLDGDLVIGLDDDELVRLGADESAAKVAARDLAAVMSRGGSAGTTVSATLAACHATPSPLRVFATGGIGGVHPAWTSRPDVSGDLRALAERATCVVCAGAKSILDLPATLEALEACGVPVIGDGTDRFPRFFSPGTPDLPVSHVAHEATEVARLCAHHWFTLGLTSAVLLTRPVPAEVAVDAEHVDALLEAIERDAADRGIEGGARTPFVLAELARRTEGRTLAANVALLAANATRAAEVARALAALGEP